MTESELLDLVAKLIEAADHPEVVSVRRIAGGQNAPAGVKVEFGDGSHDFLLVYPQGGWKGGR